MQLQELRTLVEYNSSIEISATLLAGGWLVMITADDGHVELLEVARGGDRFFKTLDALAKLVKVEFPGKQILVFTDKNVLRDA